MEIFRQVILLSAYEIFPFNNDVVLFITSTAQIGSQKQELGKIFCGRIEKEARVNTEHWQNYLSENLKLDLLAQDTIPAGNYNITATFIIDKEGCITNVQDLEDPGYGLGRKVIRVLSGYTSKWIPAEMNGRKVKAYKKQIATIIVKNEKCNEKMLAEFML